MSDKRLTMLVDLSLCVGCNACAVACKKENAVPLSKFNTWVESFDVSRDGSIRRANVPKLCNHCDDAPCVSVCPTKATYRNEDGVVLVDPDRCIGCKYCMAACPFGVRWQNDETGEVDKCTFCYHRTEHGLLPACVSTCITGARMFGDAADPESPLAKKLEACRGGDGLMEDLGIATNVRYLGLNETLAMDVVSSVQRGGRTLMPYEGGN